MAEQTKIWPKKISVDKRIVEILSGSTYENFPKALKEIITNSYDADATSVNVSINQGDEYIDIIDNGKGMTEEDLDFYLRIAGKTREKESVTSAGRRRIGKFGVGFLAAFPFCRYYRIESTKRGSNQIISAEIPCENYFTSDLKLKDVDEIPIQGGRKTDNSIVNSQFTRVRLSGFTRIAKAFFDEEYYIKGRRSTILNLPAIDRLKWEFSEDLPLMYESEELNEALNIRRSIPFEVFVNDDIKPLFRNTYASNILESGSKNIGKIRFSYLIASDFNAINPTQGRYLKIRVLNVGVDERTTFDIGLDGRTYARLAHITGEINAEEGLGELITVSRDNFNFSPDFESFKEFFRQKLKDWANELDRISELEKLSDISKQEIRSLDKIDPDRITKEIKSFEDKGYLVRNQEAKAASAYSSDDGGKSENIFEVDKSKKEIILNKEPSDYYKIIDVSGRKLKIKLHSWDYSNEELPACRLEEPFLIVNRKYPLFENNRHVDVFIKLHAILLIKYLEGSIASELYNNLNSELLETYKDYY